MKWSTTPVIGICAARGRFQGSEGDPPVDFLPATYTSAVDAADGICVLLPQSTSTPTRVNESWTSLTGSSSRVNPNFTRRPTGRPQAVLPESSTFQSTSTNLLSSVRRWIATFLSLG